MTIGGIIMPVTTPCGITIKKLEWSEDKKPNKECRYDHCYSETPFGTILITWKSWKEDQYDAIIEQAPWGFGTGFGCTPEEARAKAQDQFEHQILLCIEQER